MTDWSYPAIFENVIGVGIGNFQNPLYYQYRSNHAIECLAKGHYQKVLWLNGKRRRVSGTSFAAPNVTGIISLFREQYPNDDPENIHHFLQEFSTPKP